MNKRKSLISIILVVCMMCTFILSDYSVLFAESISKDIPACIAIQEINRDASEPESLENPYPLVHTSSDGQQSVTNAVYNAVYGASVARKDEFVLDETVQLYANKLKTLTSFSKASKDDLEYIADYLEIDSKLLIDAEKKGYSVTDSILVAKIQSVAQLTYEEIEKGLLYYPDLKTLFKECKQYNSLIKNMKFSAKTAESIKNCFLEGYNVLDLEGPGIISEVFDVKLEDIIKKEEDSTALEKLQDRITLKDIYEFNEFVAKYNINLKWLGQFIYQVVRMNIRRLLFIRSTMKTR